MVGKWLGFAALSIVLVACGSAPDETPGSTGAAFTASSLADCLPAVEEAFPGRLLDADYQGDGYLVRWATEDGRMIFIHVVRGTCRFWETDPPWGTKADTSGGGDDDESDGR